MTDTVTPVAAWYPDPAGHADLRWWDGARWTAEVRSTADAAPAVSMDSLTPTEDRSALYAARREAHFADASQTQASTPTGSTFAAAQLGALPMRSPEQPDRFRATYEEKTYQAWRKNTAATSALIFAGINLSLMVFAFFQHYSPYYRIVPSVIGIVAAVVALRQARQTDTGLVKSLVALIVNVVVGVIAAFALVQLALGLGAAVGDGVNGFVDTPNAVYSDLVESTIQAYAAEDQGRTVIAVDCPASMQTVVGLQYSCTETLGDGSTLAVAVRVASTDGTFDYSVEGMP